MQLRPDCRPGDAVQDHRDKLTRLRQLMAEAAPSKRPQHSDEADAWLRYQAHVDNTPLPALDTSLRARQVRNINRIAVSYGWTQELQRFLDRHDASGIGSLSDDQVERLNCRMDQLENCVQNGCDPPDMPAAR